MSLSFKTIRYSHINSKKPDLAVIFPQAVQSMEESKSLVSTLKQTTNILFIESGYFGITKINSLEEASQYSKDIFRRNLFEFLGKFKYGRLYFVAGSVGAIHALYFLELYPDTVTRVILTSPALYKDRGVIINSFYKFLLIIGINSYPDKYFLILTRLFKNNPKLPWLENTYKNVIAKIGSLSYFLCIQEVVEYTTKKHSRIDQLLSKKVHIILGKRDEVFNLLCDRNLCLKACSCKFVDSDHSVLNTARDQINKLLNLPIS